MWSSAEILKWYLRSGVHRSTWRVRVCVCVRFWLWAIRLRHCTQLNNKSFWLTFCSCYIFILSQFSLIGLSQRCMCCKYKMVSVWMNAIVKFWMRIASTHLSNFNSIHNHSDTSVPMARYTCIVGILMCTSILLRFQTRRGAEFDKKKEQNKNKMLELWNKVWLIEQFKTFEEGCMHSIYTLMVNSC